MSDEIRAISKDFMKIKNLRNFDFITIHYRSGDFKTRKIFGNADQQKHKMHPTMKDLHKFAKTMLPNTSHDSKIFVMSEDYNETTQNTVFLSIGLLKKIIEKRKFRKYENTLQFLKILVELYVVSFSSCIIGNHFSTLSELAISYNKMRWENSTFFFLKIYFFKK